MINNRRTRLHRNKRGSNQYRTRQRGWFAKHDLALFFLAFLFWLIVIGLVNRVWNDFMSNYKPANTVSPLAISTLAMTIKPRWEQPTLAPVSEREANIQIIKKIWGKDWETGVAIARCESGLRSEAFNGHNTNGTFDAGLFQINQIHNWTKEQLLDPVANTGIAYAKFVDQGTNPWYSSAKCWKGNI